MMLFYVIAILAALVLIRTFYVFVRFRQLAAEQKCKVSQHLAEGL